MFDLKKLDRGILRAGYAAFNGGSVARAAMALDHVARKLPPGFDPDLLARAYNEPFYLGLAGRCCVYFLSSGRASGPLKIGFASNLRQRVCELQVGNPEALFVHGVMAGADRNCESVMHKRFEGCWLRGEWFRRSPELHDLVVALPDVRKYSDGHAAH